MNPRRQRARLEAARTPWVAAIHSARAHERRGDWEQAEGALASALVLARETGRHELVWSTLRDIAAVRAMAGDHEGRVARLRAALDEARACSDQAYLPVALLDLVAALLVRAPDEALAVACEAVEVTSRSLLPSIFTAGALIARARCLLAMRRSQDAVRDLAAADAAMPPDSGKATSARVLGEMAALWETKALVRLLAGDRAGTAQALGSAVGCRRRLAATPPVARYRTALDLAAALEQYARALQGAGEPDAASLAFAEASDVRDRIRAGAAARPPTPRTRPSATPRRGRRQ